MNDAQKTTIVTLLSKEIEKGEKANWDFDHLWETLNAFDDMWNNQQMVKE
jgi:hypothetical protein